MKFIIQGGRPLRGAVRVGGAKNAGFKLMIAAGLSEAESRILNLSDINDVRITGKTLKKLGIGVVRCGDKTFFIRPGKKKLFKISGIAGEKSRGSTLFAAMLLAKFGRAIIPLPGGCVLGERPVNRHLQALEALGARVKIKGNYIYLSAAKLKGAKFRFTKKSHTGTEAMIIGAVKAQGTTIIENSGQEPEIDDLIAFLNKMGAKIKRFAKEKIVINGVQHLKGAIYRVMPDRNEAVSYAVAALATKGDIVLENAKPEHLQFFLKNLEKIGAKFKSNSYGIRFWYEKDYRACNIETKPAPGFMTDWQPLWTILMTQAIGVSRIVERVHNNRFQYVEQLNKMGAKISFYQPKIKNPNQYYEFDNADKDPNFHAIKVFGKTPLKGIRAKVTDLRAGATLVIAALTAKGEAVISNISHIDRGYEGLDEKLRQLGGRIKRIK